MIGGVVPKKIVVQAAIRDASGVVVEWINARDVRDSQVLVLRVDAESAHHVANALRDLAKKLQIRQAELQGDYTECIE